MKIEEVRGLSLEELKKKEAELKESLFEMKMKNALGQLGNPLDIRSARRDIARVKTALKDKSAQA
jgi:large subunit ribosomal protein L29